MKLFGYEITIQKIKPTWWTHVVLTFSPRGRLRLFVNGTENKKKNLTLEFYIDDETIAKLGSDYSLKKVIEIKNSQKTRTLNISQKGKYSVYALDDSRCGYVRRNTPEITNLSKKEAEKKCGDYQNQYISMAMDTRYEVVKE